MDPSQVQSAEFAQFLAVSVFFFFFLGCVCVCVCLVSQKAEENKTENLRIENIYIMFLRILLE